MKKIKKEGASYDPRKIVDCVSANKVYQFFPDLLHLLKNLRTRLIELGDFEAARILSFFIDMKKNEHLDMNQDSSVVK